MLIEYAQASEYAKELGLKEYFVDFIEMQKAEAEHEFVLREIDQRSLVFPDVFIYFSLGKFAKF